VYPALAVVEELEEKSEVLWIGGEGGMEASLVERAGITFDAIPAAGVHGVGLKALPKNILALLRGVFAARKILRRFKPDVMFFTGGYVGVPVALAGWRVPKVAYVPDIEPGLALKFIGLIANTMAVTTEESRKYYAPRQNVVVSGYPTRRALYKMTRELGRVELELHNEKPVVLVFGGSRGARSINQALWSVLERLLSVAQVVHITGSLDWVRVEVAIGSLPEDLRKDYHPHAYLHDEMSAALASAELVVSRAGAAILGEYPVFGLPAILVPYPHAWKYQKVNADYLCNQGAAIQIRDGDLAEQLLPTILDLLQDPGRRQSMREAALEISRPTAAQSIAGEIERLAMSKEEANG
jgi:UDP-N-acetylglucosamine--N-acetylmuramyl-(pentapeptide) pyrophosphoryl-undecaprenol N-acetylglucosamine transferase